MSGPEHIPFHRPSLDERDERAVLEVLRSGWLTTGAKAKELERRVAAACGVAHAVATNSCTAALHLALVGLDVGPGDEVITTPITFASTANVIVHVGATPVFCDVAPDTLCMDPASLEAAITPRTRAIIAVHFAGHPCDMDEIGAVAARHGVPLIEDAAHALGATYRGRPVGSLGHAAAFSFYATKNITTGEGGMLTTDDAALAERAAILSLHGISRDAWMRYTDAGYKHWDIVAAGFKYNMPDLLAALGLSQLERLEELRRERARLTQLYDGLLAGLDALVPLRRRPYVDAAYHLYVVRLAAGAPLTRDEFTTALQARGIGVGVHFRAVHLHPFYREKYGFRPGVCPVSEAAGDAVVSLPLFVGLTVRQVERVAAACREILGGV